MHTHVLEVMGLHLSRSAMLNPKPPRPGPALIWIISFDFFQI